MTLNLLEPEKATALTQNLISITKRSKFFGKSLALGVDDDRTAIHTRRTRQR